MSIRHLVLGFLASGCIAMVAGCSGDGTGDDQLCGNGEVDTDEQCDGSEMDGVTCQSLGYGGDTLSCAVDCTFDTSGCGEPLEICDNWFDDDGDGAVDCADDECCGRLGCDCFEICENGVDDDSDGSVDCEDTDCDGHPSC